MNRDAVNQWVVGKMNTQNISMRELGRSAGVDHSTLSKVLSGKRDAALDFYVRVARAFDAVPEMLQVAGVLSSDETAEMSLFELFRIIKNLSPEERQEVEDFVDYLTHKRAARPGTNLATGDA